MADEPKWTPGPWAAEQDDDSMAYADVYENSGRKSFHVCSVTVIPNGEHEANAHLIAAAPDLYAALDDLLASYAEPDQQICCGGHGCGCRGASVRDLAEHHARAAIAKARGAA